LEVERIYTAGKKRGNRQSRGKDKKKEQAIKAPS